MQIGKIHIWIKQKQVRNSGKRRGYNIIAGGWAGAYDPHHHPLITTQACIKLCIPSKIKGFGDGEENQRVEGRKKQILDDKSSTTR